MRALNKGFTPATGFTGTVESRRRSVRSTQGLCDSRPVAAVAPRPVQHYNSMVIDSKFLMYPL